MTRSKKRNLIILITLILTFIAVLGVYWGLIGFNPLIWIQNNANIININNYFTQSKPISTSNSSLSLSMKIKISTIFN